MMGKCSKTRRPIAGPTALGKGARQNRVNFERKRFQPTREMAWNGRQDGENSSFALSTEIAHSSPSQSKNDALFFR